MPVNKITVDNAKETMINKNHKSRNEFCFNKKTLHNENKGIIVFCEIFSQLVCTH